MIVSDERLIRRILDGRARAALVAGRAEPYRQPLEVADDVAIIEVVRALARGGLTLSNVSGRGLCIVRAPTPDGAAA